MERAVQEAEISLTDRNFEEDCAVVADFINPTREFGPVAPERAAAPADYDHQKSSRPRIPVESAGGSGAEERDRIVEGEHGAQPLVARWARESAAKFADFEAERQAAQARNANSAGCHPQ